MFDDKIVLLTETETTDAYGDPVKVIAEKTLFAEAKSISQSEFYKAQAVGLQPEIKFVIADFADYSGQKQLKYTPFGGSEGIYDVLRTYRNKINLEIVCKKGIE